MNITGNTNYYPDIFISSSNHPAQHNIHTNADQLDSPTYNNIYLEKSDNSELLLAKNVPAGSRVMSP